jgi:hypothetical protein
MADYFTIRWRRRSIRIRMTGRCGRSCRGSVVKKLTAGGSKVTGKRQRTLAGVVIVAILALVAVRGALDAARKANRL